MLTNGLRTGFVDLFRAPRQARLSHQALDVLVEGLDVLRKLELDPRVSEGTLLGAFREETFISHDTDIDVAVVGPIPTARVLVAMNRRGFAFVRILWHQWKIQQIAFVHRKTGDIFDIVVWWASSDGKLVAKFPELDYPMTVDDRQFDSPEFITIDGTRFPTHASPQAWLVDQYGEDWTIPETQKTDWRVGRPFSGRGRPLTDEQ